MVSLALVAVDVERRDQKEAQCYEQYRGAAVPFHLVGLSDEDVAVHHDRPIKKRTRCWISHHRERVPIAIIILSRDRKT